MNLVVQLPFQAILLMLALAVALCVYGVVMTDPSGEARLWRKTGRVLLGMGIASSGILMVISLILFHQF